MSMELEYETAMIPITENFQDDIKAYVKERWEVLPGSKPVAIYNLVRIKRTAEVPQAAGIGGLGSLQIDETKISIIRGGKRVRPDGELEDDAGGKVIDGGTIKLSLG